MDLKFPATQPDQSLCFENKRRIINEKHSAWMEQRDRALAAEKDGHCVPTLRGTLDDIHKAAMAAVSWARCWMWEAHAGTYASRRPHVPQSDVCPRSSMSSVARFWRRRQNGREKRRPPRLWRLAGMGEGVVVQLECRVSDQCLQGPPVL